MTDFTTDTPVHRSKSHPPKGEYYTYFALIFMATLAPALIAWALKALRRMELPEKGPIASAWSQALIITPRIFSA